MLFHMLWSGTSGTLCNVYATSFFLLSFEGKGSASTTLSRECLPIMHLVPLISRFNEGLAEKRICVRADVQ